MVIGHCAQCPSGGSLLEEHRQQADQHSGDQGRVQVFLVDQDAAFKNTLQGHDRVLGHADINLVDVAAEDGLPDAVQEVADAQRRHQQGCTLLVDQMPQGEAFNQPGHAKHHHPGPDEGQQVGNEGVVQAGIQRYPLGKARHRQRGKQHHRALRKIEHARSFVDQYKAQCDQRIEHARHQAAHQGFKKKCHGSSLAASVARAQIGTDHFFVVAYFIGGSVTNLLAVVQHHDPVRDVHHHTHVMLDQHHGGAELLVDVKHEAAHVLLLFDVHARHGFVQQQHLRLHRQRATQVNALLKAVGQLANRGLAKRLDLQEVDDVFDFLAVHFLFALGRPNAQRLPEQVALDLEVAPGHDVVDHAHALEQRQVLEGAPDTHHGHLVAVHVAEGLSAETDGALLRRVNPIDAVEHGALARAVGADDGAYFVFAHVKRDVGQRLDAAETQADVLDVQDDVAD